MQPVGAEAKYREHNYVGLRDRVFGSLDLWVCGSVGLLAFGSVGASVGAKCLPTSRISNHTAVY